MAQIWLCFAGGYRLARVVKFSAVPGVLCLAGGDAVRWLVLSRLRERWGVGLFSLFSGAVIVLVGRFLSIFVPVEVGA